VNWRGSEIDFFLFHTCMFCMLILVLKEQSYQTTRCRWVVVLEQCVKMWGGESCPDSRLFQPFHILAGKKIQNRSGNGYKARGIQANWCEVKRKTWFLMILIHFLLISTISSVPNLYGLGCLKKYIWFRSKWIVQF